ncbi:hypothetical protein EAN04_24660 [Salmonella enterica]|nr:hypothetical protein [Salmonella enterica]
MIPRYYMHTSYSAATVARCFTVLKEFEVNGHQLAVIFDEETPRVAVINRALELFDGVERHRVVAILFGDWKAPGSKEYLIERYWVESEQALSEWEPMELILPISNGLRTVGVEIVSE